jgi:hypothetical protein
VTARALTLVLVLATTAHADADRCRDAIVKASAKHAQAVAKVLQHCDDRVLAGRLPPSSDCHGDPLLAVAATKLGAAIAHACCGADGACGTADDESLAAIGWNIGQCPDFETLGCNAPIASPGDIGPCVACVAVDATEQLAGLAAGKPAPPGTSCRRTMGKETARLFRSASTVLARCWQARSRGLHANPCPVSGDGVAGPAIASAAATAQARICAVCGGPDGVCGGGDDVTLADAGAPDRCPPVTVPGGSACGGPIATMGDLVDCVGCLTLFGVSCSDRVAIPAFATYPAECNPPPGSCSAGVTCDTSLDCPAGYSCEDNGGNTRYCVGATCTTDGDCAGGGVCRQYCTSAGCGGLQCQCPGFGCTGPDQLCIDDGGLACRKLCTQDSDCTDPFGFVCVNPGFSFGVCIGQTPCQ